MIENVKRGAELLDKYIPDWYEKVNNEMVTGRFNMRNWEHCIAGSLEIFRYEDGRESIALNGVVLVGYEEAVAYGFAISVYAGQSSWNELEILWRHEVEERLTKPC